MHRRVGILECEILLSPADLAPLRAEWTRLFQAAPNAHLAEAFEWAEACLRASPLPGEDALRCVVIRNAGALVAIAPFVTSGSVVRVARPLACTSTEYCPLLIDPSARVNIVWRAIEDQLRHGSGVDVIVLPHVRADEALGVCLEGREDWFVQEVSPAPMLRRSAYSDWSAYWARRSNKVQSNISRKRRRLAALGEVSFEEVADADARRQAWRWLMAQKRGDFANEGLFAPTLTSSDYARFVEETLEVWAPGARRAIFCLKVGGKIIAAELDSIDRRRVETFVTSFDPAYRVYAPGNILRQEVVRWAFSHGLDFDWRLGEQAFKLDWASETVVTRTCVLALTRVGRWYLRYLKARSWCERRAPAGLRMKIRGLAPAVAPRLAARRTFSKPQPASSPEQRARSSRTSRGTRRFHG